MKERSMKGKAFIISRPLFYEMEAGNIARDF